MWGPRVIQLDASGRIWLAFNKEILITNPDGSLLNRINLDKYGMTGPVTTIVPLPSTDKAVRMLIGSIGATSWPVLDEEGKLQNTITPSGITVPAHETYHLATTPEGHIAMSTGGMHNVLLFDRDGHFLKQSQNGIFRFANDIWFENVLENPNENNPAMKLEHKTSESIWWVADSKYHKIQALEKQSLKPKQSIELDGVDNAKFPVAVRKNPHKNAAKGQFTVTFLENAKLTGQVAEVDSQGQTLFSYPMPAKTEPSDFLWIEDRIMILNAADFSVRMFDKNGHFLLTWGNAELKSLFKKSYTNKNILAKVTLGGQICSVLFGILALLLYFKKQSSDRSFKQQQLVTLRMISETQLKPYTPYLQGLAFKRLSLNLLWPALLLISLGVALMVFGWKKHLPFAYLPLLVLVLLAHVSLMQRKKAPRFEALQSSQAINWVMQAPCVGQILMENEQIQEVLPLFTSWFGIGYNRQILVLSNRRVMVFKVNGEKSGKLNFFVPRQVIMANLHSPSLIKKLFGLPAKIVLKNGKSEVFFYALIQSHTTALRIIDLINVFNKKLPQSHSKIQVNV